MPRAPNVTRHVTHTRCICRCVHKYKGFIFGVQCDLPRAVTNSRRRLELCRKILENDYCRVLCIEEYKIMETYASMSEVDFIKNATNILSQEVIYDSTK